jgi:hypothetical protein
MELHRREEVKGVEGMIYKMRISVLWIFMAVAMSAHSLFSIMEPGTLEQIAAMQMGTGMWLFMALFWLVPLTMAFLSVTLSDSTNRKVNMIMGVIFTALNVFHFAEHVANPSAQQFLIIGSTVIVTALVTWYAWKWPKQET